MASELALEGVLSRAKLAYHRIPQEVRNVVIRKGAPEDGTTTAMRPLPGVHECTLKLDIPTTPINPAVWQSIRSNLPPSRDERLTRLNSTDLSENQINALVSGELDDYFMDGIAGEFELPQKAGQCTARLWDRETQRSCGCDSPSRNWSDYPRGCRTPGERCCDSRHTHSSRLDDIRSFDSRI